MGFFKPAWQDNDTKKAVRAVGRIRNQRQLIEIVEYDYALNESVKDAALDNMVQETLENLALNGKDPAIRVKAIGMIQSHDALIRIIKREIPNYRPFGSPENRVALFALKSVLHSHEVDTSKKADAVRLCEDLIFGEGCFGADLFEYNAVPDSLREQLGFEVRHSKDRVDGAESTWYEDRYTVFYQGKEIGSFMRQFY